MSATKLEAKLVHPREDFAGGIVCDNAEQASRLIGAGEAALKISVYPWGAEFELVDSDEREGLEED